MQQMLFEDKSTPIQGGSQNHLNIECGFGLLKAVVINASSNKIIWAVATESENFIATIDELELTKHHFEKVTVSFSNEYFTLLPNALFEAEKIRDYLNFNFEVLDKTEADHNQLRTIDAHNCYLYLSSLKNELETCFKQAEFIHQSMVFIELNRVKDSMILIELFPTHFQLMHVVNNQFKLANTFQYQNEADMLYFATYALQQLKVANEAKILFSGWTNLDDKLYIEFKKFFPNTSIYLAEFGSMDSSLIPTSKKHIFNQVARQHLCG